MTESQNVAVIGAGQAGLAVSWYLKNAGVDHVILEAGRVGETWRTRRWDTFCLVTPNWTVKLPGATYDGPDPDGFIARDEIVSHLERWAGRFDAPVRGGTDVVSVQADGPAGFKLHLADTELQAHTVVVATGAYQRPHRPNGADGFSSGVTQILAEAYRNPAALPPGGVLIIGSGQTGCQLAEELHEAGRRVLLACGRAPWIPRRLEGRDTLWWLEHAGFFERTPDQLPSPAARLVSNPLASGHAGGHDLNYRTLHALGVELLGRFAGAEGSKAAFADDLAASVDFGDARWAELSQSIETSCARRGVRAPDMESPAPLRLETATELDVDKERIGTVIWTSGYRPDYAWVMCPVFDAMGFPVTQEGASAVPGLYFVGVHWMRKLKSAILYGVGEDAQLVAHHIIEHRS